jgi:hypothetical protein
MSGIVLGVNSFSNATAEVVRGAPATLQEIGEWREVLALVVRVSVVLAWGSW